MTSTARPGGASSPALRLVTRFGPLLFLFALMAVFAVANDAFLSQLNLFNVARQISITGLIALGMTFVILTAGIDLSVGSLLAFAGMVAAVVAKGTTANTLSLGTTEASGWGWPAAMLAAVAVGTLAGAIQGGLVTKLRVPPFVVTLGGLTIFRGFTLMLSGGGPISGFSPGMRWWGTGLVGPVPVPVIVFAGAAILCHLVLRYTRFGRAVYAVGGNAEAARLAGIRTDRVIVGAHVLCSLCAALAGLYLASRLRSGAPWIGREGMYDLESIAVAVIGGTVLAGGRGGVWGTMAGVAIFAMIDSLFNVLGVDAFAKQVLRGLIIVAAVAVYAVGSRRLVA